MSVCFADGEGSLPYPKPNMTDDKKKKKKLLSKLDWILALVVKFKRIYDAYAMATLTTKRNLYSRQ